MSDSARQTPSPEAPERAGDAPAVLADAVRLCRRQRRFLAELRGLYQEINGLTAASPARCLGGGGCCKFDLAGHRLYLTAGELAILTNGPPPPPLAPGGRGATISLSDVSPVARRGRPEMRCPYQRRGKCQAYDRRPLGCRAYFCRPGDPDWSGRLYEQYHKNIARLHERFALPYLYVELTAGLMQVLA